MKFLKPIRRLIILCVFITLATHDCISQTAKIDSLSRSLSEETTDSTRVTLLWQLALQFQSFKPDTALQLAQRGLLLAKRIKFTEGESRSLAQLANSQYLLGDYPNALNNYILRLRIEEHTNNPRNFASALNNIGITYILLEEYPHALEYLYRADSTVNAAGEKTKAELQYSILVNMGEAYYRMNLSDSATHYFDRSLNLAKVTGDSAAIGAAILGKANVLVIKNKINDALRNYKEAITYLYSGSDEDILCELSLGMAKVYERLSRNDSAAYFAIMSYSRAANSNFLSRQLDAALFLSGVYNKLKKYDSAFSFLQQSVQLKDSLKGNEKIRAAMLLSVNEKLRQEEIADQKLKDKEARYQQLQWVIIALCIPVLFLITLLVSKIKISHRMVSFMTVISLLFLFEFLTLLLHPVIAELTHHIPVFELFIFVCIAALIIPVHHRLQHTLIHRLTQSKHHQNLRINTKKIRKKTDI